MSNLFRKADPANLHLIEVHIGKLRAEIAELADLSLLTDTLAWKKVQVIIKRKADSIEYDLDNFGMMDERHILTSLQARKDLKYFLGLVEGGEFAIDDLNKKLTLAEKELSDLKERLG